LGRIRLWSGLQRRLSDPPVATLLQHGLVSLARSGPLRCRVAQFPGALGAASELSGHGASVLVVAAEGQGRARQRGYGAAVFYLFVTALHSGFLGILLTVAREPIYPLQTSAAPEWGLTPLEDQQLAGLIMWVPAGLVYAVAALALAGLWIRHSGLAAKRDGSDALITH